MQMGNAILLGVARPGFDTDLAMRMFRESVGLLEKLGATVLRPDALLTDPDEAGRAAAGYRDRGADELVRGADGDAVRDVPEPARDEPAADGSGATSQAATSSPVNGSTRTPGTCASASVHSATRSGRLNRKSF